MGALYRAWGQWLGFTLVYTAAIYGGRHLTLYEHGGPPVAWPASGLLFAAFVLTRRRAWPYLVGSCVVGMVVILRLAHLPVLNATVIVPFVCLPAALGAELLHHVGRRLDPRGRREHVRASALVLIGGVVVPAAVASLFTIFYASSDGEFSGRLYLTSWGQAAVEFWRARFAGASLGIMTITPFVVAVSETWRRGPRRAGVRARLIDAGIVAAACAGAAVVFTAPAWPRELRSPSLLMPLLVLVSLRGSMTLTTLANMITAWIMIFATIADRGAFSIFFGDAATRTTALQVFVWTAVFSQTIFTAVIAGRARLAELLGGRGEELERLNEDLIRAKEAAVTADAAKSRVLAHVTHEIRTPLGAMIGFAGLALDESPPPDVRRYLEIIHKNGLRLSELVDQTLDLGKIEAGRFAVDARPIDVRDLTTEILNLMQVKAREKGLALSMRFGPGVPLTFHSDPLRVRQVLMNLIGNAVKFTDAGSVILRAKAAARGLIFEIEDTGPGLTAAQGEALFRPYQQGDATTARRYGGTGLGLTLSRELARLLGGDVVLKAAGPGATFVFTLPEWPKAKTRGRARPPRGPSPPPL